MRNHYHILVLTITIQLGYAFRIMIFNVFTYFLRKSRKRFAFVLWRLARLLYLLHSPLLL